jgi:cytidyltransferase-like protein
VILSTDELEAHQREVAMVDGGFDPIHGGHVAYLREAARLDAPLLCNVSSDEYVASKHPAFLPQDERATIIDAFRWVAYTHISSIPTVEVLRRLIPRYYVKGEDWQARLPPDEARTCADLGIEIVYLDTVSNSSSAVLDDYVRRATAARTTAG